MDYRTTSTRSQQAGTSLLEMIVVTGILSIILVCTGSLAYHSSRSFAALANYVDLDRYSRNALDRMSKEIRQANYLTEATESKLVFNDFDGQPLTYEYSPDDKTLTRTKGERAETLLRECSYLKFSIYQRNPVGGTYDQYPTATPATCKLVQLSWICSRQWFGNLLNTESVQSAKIVIRKE